jgi:hypothetical protein
MKEYSSENVEVRGYVKPGVSTDILVKTASNEINSLTKKDAIILWGGSNDIGNNNSRAGLRNISPFVKNNSHINIVLVGVSHRFDLPDAYLLTPLSRVLLEKLTGSAASQEIPRILWNLKVH